MLVEMAVADAYAIPWEFTKQQTAPNDLSAFNSHPTYVELKPGQYTDDTQRAVANCDVILSWNSLDLYNPEAYAQAYLNAYNRDPREGYSRGYQSFLKSVTNGREFLRQIQRTKTSNGSVMGVAPMGLMADIHQVKLASMIQAITTHHPETAIHAQIVAMSVHYFTHLDNGREFLRHWLTQNADWRDKSDQADEWTALIDAYATGKKTSIEASSISAYMVYAVQGFDRLTDIMKDAVARGGDTDSAAAVAVAVASCCLDIENDIPEHLALAMDAANPGFGIEYLTKLERRVRERNLMEDDQ